jgi:hypothetical protein
MLHSLLVVCVIPLNVLSAVPVQAEPSRLSTDWLTPPIRLQRMPDDVAAIDVAIHDRDPERLAGTMTLYLGQPSFNEFGDADQRQLRKRDVPVEFRRKAKTALQEPPWMRARPDRHESSELFEPSDASSVADVRLVLSTESPGDCRMLVVNPAGEITRVLPLKSEPLWRQAEQHPQSDPTGLRLRSDLFIGHEDRFNVIRLVGTGGNLKFSHDRNHFTLNRLGAPVMSTLMGFPIWECTLRDLQVPDRTGQARRLFACELVHSGVARNLGALQPVSKDFDEAFLVLHPREGGWHRILLKRSGQLHRLLPMHSERLDSWLRVKSQLSDATEQQVFEQLSRAIPYFSAVSLKQQRITEIRLPAAALRAEIAQQLAELPQLSSLEIDGDLTDDAPLDRITRLEQLRLTRGRVSEQVLERIGRLTNLKSLNFYTVRLDCRGLKHLSGLRGLTHFVCRQGDPGNFAENYDDSCVLVFSAWPELQELNLRPLPLTPTAVERLPTARQINSVSFGDSVPIHSVLKYAQSNPTAKIEVGSASWRLADGEILLPESTTNDDLRELATMAGLHTLTFVSADSLTDDGLAHLTSLKLKQLNLSRARQVTDAGMAHIARITTLESLKLSSCRNLTNSTIAHLKQLPSLRKVSILGTKIDPKAFKAALPNCEIGQ